MSGELKQSHPLYQTNLWFTEMYGNVYKDFCRSVDSLKKYQAAVNYQEKIRSASSGRAAYNKYRGPHGKGSGNNFLTSSDVTLPDIDAVFSPSPSEDAWWRHSPFPQYENGVDLTFLIAIIEFLANNIPPKRGIVVCSSFTVIFCSRAWDGKALNSGAFIWGSKIYGTIPPLSIEECRDMVNRGLSDCLAALMKQFKERGRLWVKEAEVHSVQLLTFPIDIPVGVLFIDKCGTEADVTLRLDRIYKFLQCCTNCLQQAIENGTQPVCTVWCKECFSLKRVCEITRIFLQIGDQTIELVSRVS